jgi:alpha-D-ribose 1-methylphosphonate 5-triphosphate synthase subunit PhnG
MFDNAPAPDSARDERRYWMSVLAKADPRSLARAAASLGEPPVYDRLRGPETGLVMVRGRAGGVGAMFNVGEMSVTRCAVRLAGEDGLVGHAYVRGRDAAHAETAAWLDAWMQSPVHRARVEAAVIAPLAAETESARDLAARKAAATKVDFFTMATGRPQL